jgi:hypothetical protein
MRILVFEDNLMWSSRLSQTLRGTGHEPLLRKGLPEDAEGAAVAVINLGQSSPDPRDLVQRLHNLGVRVLAHAGHKEKELLELGRLAGADRLATNSELTFKLPQLVEELAWVESPDEGAGPNDGEATPGPEGGLSTKETT